MKKTSVVFLLILSLALVFCAACAKNDSTPAKVSATMEPTPTPTEAPTPTPETTPSEAPSATPETTEVPEQATATAQAATAPAANTGSAGGTTNQATAAPVSEPTPAQDEPEPSQDKKAVAQGMIGQSVSALTSAIGAPNSSLYTESCLVMNGEDGVLEYDGFTVSTVRYSDGSELILGVY